MYFCQFSELDANTYVGHRRLLCRGGRWSTWSYLIYTTENGQLAFKIHEKGEKIKVTYAAPPKTFSVQDINQIVG